MVMLEAKKFLICGGEGFIGWKLALALVKLGHRVVTVDNNITSMRKPQIPGVTFIRKGVEEVEISGDFDGIFYLASVAAPRLFAEDPIAVMTPNMEGLQNIIEFAKSKSCRLLYASSSEVYGNAGALAQDALNEQRSALHDLLSEKSVYSVSKMIGEELIKIAANEGLDACSMRLFNVYGPNMDPTIQGRGRVIPNFINALQNNLPIPIEGDGEQTRSFMYIDDCVDALVSLMDCEHRLPFVINIGSENHVTIKELAFTIAEIFEVVPTIEYSQRLSGDPDWRLPDCSLMEKLTGWTWTTRLIDGLRMTIENY
jgi:nucleoside-diphosphate-sugar epimerase